MADTSREYRRGLGKPETKAVTNGAAVSFTKTMAERRTLVLEADVDCWYRLDGTAAIAGATSFPLRAGQAKKIVYDGTNTTVSIIAASVSGNATLSEQLMGR